MAFRTKSLATSSVGILLGNELIMDSLPPVGKPSYQRAATIPFSATVLERRGCYVRRRVVWRLQRGRRDKGRRAQTKVVRTGDPLVLEKLPYAQPRSGLPE